ncbi:V-type ATPase subunit [Candidatus Bathyarchaeota archaeon]|nr:V-type ATPase subunit [Candidatus Bathyarchaeota archaeon]
MSAWKYKRIMSKITVAKLQLMEPKKITELAGMNLHHISSMLEKTPYKPEIAEIRSKELSSSSLEDALLQNFIKTCEELMISSPKGIRLLLSTFLMKFEANCVKGLLRAKQAELDVEEAMKYIMPVGRLDETRCRKTLEISENTADIVESFSDLEYGSVLEKAFAVYEEEKIFYLLEVALDRHVYSKIWRAIGKFRGLDKKIARTVIGLEIDSVNVKTILRCKAMGISKNQIRRYLIPVSEVLGEKELEEAMSCLDMQSTINSLAKSAKRAMARDHQYIFTELKELHVTSLTTLETVLDRGLVETSLRMLKRYTPFFNIGLILAFLNLKWFEVKNLRAIIRGSEAGFPPERVKKLLILPR